MMLWMREVDVVITARQNNDPIFLRDIVYTVRYVVLSEVVGSPSAFRASVNWRVWCCVVPAFSRRHVTVGHIYGWLSAL